MDAGATSTTKGQLPLLKLPHFPLFVLLDGSLDGRRVGTNDLGDLLAVLEEEESWHGADTQLLRDIGELVNVDLVELDTRVFLCKSAQALAADLSERSAEEHHLLDNLGCDDLAGTAPNGEAVDDVKAVLAIFGLLLLDDLLPVGLTTLRDTLADADGNTAEAHGLDGSSKQEFL